MDKYIRALAPPAELFSDFKIQDRKLKNHNAAFALVNCEARFDLSEERKQQLSLLVQVSRQQDVALICQCRDFDRCHCDLLLIWAERKLGPTVQGLIYDYPICRARLENFT